jgi:NADPH:quinone reductase-like Zn-dependent oxidoreductase
LSLFDGLAISLPDPASLPAVSEEWVLVLGGGSSVGKYAIQVPKLLRNHTISATDKIHVLVGQVVRF